MKHDYVDERSTGEGDAGGVATDSGDPMTMLQSIGGAGDNFVSKLLSARDETRLALGRASGTLHADDTLASLPADVAANVRHQWSGYAADNAVRALGSLDANSKSLLESANRERIDSAVQLLQEGKFRVSNYRVADPQGRTASDLLIPANQTGAIDSFTLADHQLSEVLARFGA